MGQIIEFLTLRRLLFSSGSNLKISWVVHPEWLKDEVKATRKQKEGEASTVQLQPLSRQYVEVPI
ncbi:hypothetical protein SOVF_152960 isoform A [Spinacia oleracea]|nr:hypothetical protein SOVF_152960 isoform A [Spinacia oleracea]